MAFEIAGLEPLVEDGSVHWDVSFEPGMRDGVEAGFDVALQDPFRGVAFGECDEALRDGIRRRPLFAKAVGVGVGGRLGDRVEGQEV